MHVIAAEGQSVIAPSYPKIAVVIPSYRVRNSIVEVLGAIGDEVAAIFVVDDACPQETGKFVRENCDDPRIQVIYHSVNEGVGGAMISGYKAAIAWGAEIIIKIDGDGQMDPRLLPAFVQPIVSGKADYVKGNRFFSLETLRSMPKIRLLGNSALSFFSKAASGYWNIMDPTNGYTAVHVDVLKMISLDKLDKRYFFESDMLFRLNTVRAVVKDVTMDAKYVGESSNLSIIRATCDFPGKYLRCFIKRIFYTYFLRDFNPCSINIVVGFAALLFGCTFGAWHWYLSFIDGVPAPTGTVMLAALPVILGVQLLLSAINYDLANFPKEPVHRLTPVNRFSE